MKPGLGGFAPGYDIWWLGGPLKPRAAMNVFVAPAPLLVRQKNGFYRASEGLACRI
jgi:hypothetical protein